MVRALNIIEANISVPRFRAILAQCIAIMSPSMLLLDIGMAVSFPTIAVPDMLHSTTDLSLDDVQASWFGSLSYLTQPFGALMSGPLVDHLGRKRASMLVNIPHIVAWVIMYFAPNLPAIFIANGLLGLGNGLMEASIFAYVGEVSEASVRGALSIVIQCFYAGGILGMYFLGTVVYWREAALISLSAPIIAMLLISLVPETPVWLLSQGREKDALKSLCYLRGWTSEDNVKEEFDQLVQYSKDLHRCALCCQEEVPESVDNDKGNTDCEHTKLPALVRIWKKFNVVMLCKETLRPLSLVMMYFLFFVMSGLTPLRPIMVNLCGAYGMAVDGKNVTFMVGVINLLTSIVVVGIIKFTGKRKMVVVSLMGTGLVTTALSVYANKYLGPSVFSFDPTTYPTEKSYVPVIYFYIFAVFTACNMSWVLLGEVFPFRSRASAQGISAAWNYVVTFVGAKTYLDLETSFRLTGTFAVYAAFCYIGAIYLYFFLPETEGVELEDIEKFYKGKFRTFADDPLINSIKKCTKYCRKKVTKENEAENAVSS